MIQKKKTDFDYRLQALKDRLVISGLKRNLNSRKQWIIGRLTREGTVHFVHFSGLYVGDPMAAERYNEDEADQIIADNPPGPYSVWHWKQRILQDHQ